MRKCMFTAGLILSVGLRLAAAQEAKGPFDQLSASKAVQQGNTLLMDGDALTALEAYQRAASQESDALEIPFVQGLAHFNLGEYEQARGRFERAVLSDNKALADNALYGMAACDHAEALQQETNPQAAIEKLESAMSRYQQVLAHNKEHKLARDTNTKAATMWRQVKQLLEQQPQEQPQEGDQQQDDPQEQQEGEQQPQDGQQENQDQQQSSAEQDQKQEQEQQAQAEEAKEQDATQQQAENRLRAWMEQLRERLKRREQPTAPPPIAPLDKDW